MGSFWFSKIVVLIFWDFIYFYFLRVGLVLFFSNLKKKKNVIRKWGFAVLGLSVP